MAGQGIFGKAQKVLGVKRADRGHVVYRTDESIECPGCGATQWYVGRISAECGSCGTAVALAEVNFGVTGPRRSAGTTSLPYFSVAR